MSVPDGRPPKLGPTRGSTLLVAGLAAAAVVWLLISRFYDRIIELPWLPVITLFGLAALEAVAAGNTRARVERREGTEPVDPLLVARYVVLAKASALGGAIFTGLYAGVLAALFLDHRETAAFTDTLPAGIAGLAASVALIWAALRLERACRVPTPPPGPSGENFEPAPGPADGSDPGS